MQTAEHAVRGVATACGWYMLAAGSVAKERDMGASLGRLWLVRAKIGTICILYLQYTNQTGNVYRIRLYRSTTGCHMVPVLHQDPLCNTRRLPGDPDLDFDSSSPLLTHCHQENCRQWRNWGLGHESCLMTNIDTACQTMSYSRFQCNHDLMLTLYMLRSAHHSDRHKKNGCWSLKLRYSNPSYNGAGTLGIMTIRLGMNKRLVKLGTMIIIVVIIIINVLL